MLLQTDMAGCVCKTKIGGCASKEYYWTNELDCRICAEIIRRPKNIQKLNVAIVETTMAQKYDEEIQTIFTNNVGNLYWDPVDFESIADCQMENAVVRGCKDGCNLYIGKSYHDGEWKIGTVFAKEGPHKGLHIQDCFGVSHIIFKFDILKYYTTC